MTIIEGHPEEPNLDVVLALRIAIANSYRTAFAESPEKAVMAEQTANNLLTLLLATVTESSDFTIAELQELGLDQDKLKRVVAWGAFDYSRYLPDSSIETVDSKIFMAPILTGSIMPDGTADFAHGLNDFETAIIAMKVYRYEATLGAITDDPSDCFVADYEAVAGNPIEGLQAE